MVDPSQVPDNAQHRTQRGAHSDHNRRRLGPLIGPHDQARIQHDHEREKSDGKDRADNDPDVRAFIKEPPHPSEQHPPSVALTPYQGDQRRRAAILEPDAGTRHGTTRLQEKGSRRRPSLTCGLSV
jgi:hypothetical protein